MKQKILLSNLLLAMLLVSSVFLLFSFVYASMKTSSLQDISEEKQMFESSEKEFTALKNNMKDWENVENEYLGFRDTLVLKFEDFSKFRQNLELIINRNTLSKSKFVIEYKKALDNEYIKVKIHMILNGTYSNLKKFIVDISGINKIAYLRTVRLSGSESVLSGDFNMEVYLVR